MQNGFGILQHHISVQIQLILQSFMTAEHLGPVVIFLFPSREGT